MYKHLQINVEWFRFFEELLAFLKKEQPDIINLQEASDGDFWGVGEKKDFLKILEDGLWMESIPHLTIGRDFGTHTIHTGVAILSKHPIVDFSRGILYGEEAKIYEKGFPLFTESEKYKKYKYTFRLPLGYISSVICINGVYIKNMNSHFHVSYDCFETERHICDAEKIVHEIQTSKDMPTFFSGDLNLRTKTATLDMLSEKLEIQSGSFVNTLNKDVHPIFQKNTDHPGLAIDHVFSKDIAVLSCKVVEANVSDHYPVVTEFTL